MLILYNKNNAMYGVCRSHVLAYIRGGGGGRGRGFLEKGLICIKGFRFADLSKKIKYAMKMK